MCHPQIERRTREGDADLLGGDMRRIPVACAVLLCPGFAHALETEVTTSASVVPGTTSEAVAVQTLSGSVPIGPQSAPTFRFGLGALVNQDLSKTTSVTASWGLYRVQALCDTCAADDGPGWVGQHLVQSTDLGVDVVHTVPLGEDANLLLGAGTVLPASRAALACNPMYAAPGASAKFVLPVREGSSVALSVGARRPIYQYDAAPVGLCSRALEGSGTVDTLGGPVEPTPWDGGRFASANPILTGSSSVKWIDPLALVVPSEHLSTSLALGLQFSRAPAHPSAEVEALTGPVAVDPASNPVRTAVPWSAEVGWAFDERWSTSLSVSNRLPTLLADPGGTFRALPATTAIGWSLAAHL
jgi:hypothetical protein